MSFHYCVGPYLKTLKAEGAAFAAGEKEGEDKEKAKQQQEASTDVAGAESKQQSSDTSQAAPVQQTDNSTKVHSDRGRKKNDAAVVGQGNSEAPMHDAESTLNAANAATFCAVF